MDLVYIVRVDMEHDSVNDPLQQFLLVIKPFVLCGMDRRLQT
jgi:hypothetical protein